MKKIQEGSCLRRCKARNGGKKKMNEDFNLEKIKEEVRKIKSGKK